MLKQKYLVALLAGASAAALCTTAHAENFNVPGGSLKAALDAYAAQAGVQLVVSADAVKGVRSDGARGDYTADQALSHILADTGFNVHRRPSGALVIVRDQQSSTTIPSLELAQAAPAPRQAVETVTVTSSKLGGADVQSIPISITALSQEQLTATQTAGGPDLVKQVPNLTFSKTNFTGYNIQVRGIGTQAISVTTDPAVAVALNDIPFIRNHFFEQEFYDLSQAEVLRGPQGTLYGRNATAGVVNLITAKPSDQFEAMASGELGNYHQRRFEGMLNIPIVDDRFDLRIAGEWTKRQGYSFNDLTQQRIDGRDLWSGRMTLGLKPTERLQITAMWEHFSENDDRMRTAKQLCKTAPVPHDVNGQLVDQGFYGIAAYQPDHYLSQGCLPTSLYSSDAFQVPNGVSLPYYSPLSAIEVPINNFIHFDPYANTVQSRNLRVIETALNPIYKAKNDTVELNADYELSPELTFTSQTGYNSDFLWSTEDYNRFNTRPGVFEANGKLNSTSPLDPNNGICTQIAGDCTAIYQPCTNASVLGGSQEALCMGVGTFCDPQLGCSDRLVAQDLSTERAWQLSQEFRLASHYSGPFNFSVGGNYLHYETEENYYVFINSLSLATYTWRHGGPFPSQTLPYVPGVSDNSNCLLGGGQQPNLGNPGKTQWEGDVACAYMDPNDLEHLNDQGHNYFLNQNPYTLNSYAAFGEVYYNVLDDVKLIGGLRFTEDQKHFTEIPSQLLVPGYGYPISGVVNQQWDQFTGRAAINWTPKLDFTDQTMVYGSYAHGYKAGGANPPGATLILYGGPNGQGGVGNPIHPLTFKPEFVDAFEIGSKNTLLDGALTFNFDAFYYNYENYQISRIVDRTSINDNFDAHVKGAEIESTWEPVQGLRFNFAGGWEDTAVAHGEKSVDLMDRTDSANHPDWIVVKPFVTQASNCILPKYVVAADLQYGGDQHAGAFQGANMMTICGVAYGTGVDPITGQPYTSVQNPNFPDYPGFDPHQAGINNGEGFDKDLSGNELPNAPPFTVSAGVQYTMPLSSDWAGTLRADYYWQDYSWARIFNDRPYDRLRGYTNVNLTLILTSQAGWQVMLYDKNVFNTTAITGDFLNSDDSGLTTNVFLTDPKLIGIRVTKNW